MNDKLDGQAGRTPEMLTGLSGDLVDERLVPEPPAGKKYLRRRVLINGQERDLEGSYLAKRDGSARALLVVDATAPPTPNYSTVLTQEARELAAREGLSEAEAQAALIELANAAQWYKDQGISAPRVEYNYNAYQRGEALTWSGNVVGKTFDQMGSTAGDMVAGGAQGFFVDTPKAIYQIFRHPIETAKGIWHAATNLGETVDKAAADLNESAEKGEAGFAIGRMWGNLLGGKAIGSLGKAALTKAGSVLTAGEPVSVANGEYLETWCDFVVPGTLTFDGSRYMGLKLALPSDYISPLGPCQVSMFDEVFSNPKSGQLVFHNADGKVILFDRPFNFLPSTNSAYPNLELKAPWLKQLTLKEGRITRHFRQYDDKIYRLEKITDLNGFDLLLSRNDDGWLERADGPDGLLLLFNNDENGQRLSITLVGTDGTELQLARYKYDQKGRMVSADCDYGMSVRYSWHHDADLLSSWHNVTRQSETHFTYDAEGRVIHTRTNGIWNDDRFRYQDGETIYVPGGNEGSAQRFRYDENENITEEIDPLGGTVAHSYSRAGFRTTTTDANGNTDRTKYDQRGNVAEQTDAEGRTTTFIWGDDSELHLVIDGAGNRKSFEHDTYSNVIAETDAEGNVTRLVRDDLGHVVETHFANGAVERRTWDKHNRLETITDDKANTTRFEYDAFNRLIATISPNGSVTRQGYREGAGGFDTVSEMVRPDGVRVARSFDGQGQLASVTDGEGRLWTYRYGAFGVLKAIVDPKGGEIKLGTDIEGRVNTVTNAAGRVYSYERDAAGRVILEEDFDGRAWRYGRDPAGQVTETIKPDGAKLRYAYDKSGLIKRIETFTAKDEPEDVTRFWYDGRGLLTGAENKAALVKFERDRNGRIIGETLNGKRIKSKRDAMGNRILREITGLGGSVVDYVCDPLGAVERMVAGDREFTFKRDSLGRETERRMGGFNLLQRFDAAGQLTAQAAGPAVANNLDVSRLGWTIPSSSGPRSARAKPGQIRRLYEYDRAFAPIRIDDSSWGKRQFTYDDNGQLTDADAAFGSERYQYDEARNVVGASSSISSEPVATPYGREFDETFGSIIPAPKPSGWQTSASGVVQIARGPKGERIQLKHDDCGRLIERRIERDGFRPQRLRYRWDVYDRLVGVTTLEGEEWLFRYDPFGRRISKVRRFAEQERHSAALRWRGLVKDDGVPIATRSQADETDAENTVPTVGTAYLWDGDHMVAEAPLRLDGHIDWDEATHWHFEENSHRLLAKQLPSGEMLAIVCDHLGTPKEMFDQQGDLIWAADHHVWGTIRTTRTYGALAAAPKHQREADELFCPWRFPGQYEDAETGLYYNRHRHYDPLTGQYASPDPIGLAGGDRPQGYVANPSISVDVLGLSSVWSSVKATQPPVAGSVIPKSFEMTLSDGKRIWVHPNATKHMVDDAAAIAVERRKLPSGWSDEASKLYQQQQLGSLRGAVNTAATNGIPMDQMIKVNGWELIFSPARQAGGLPVLKHARPYGGY